jgi:hypothetical protein
MVEIARDRFGITNADELMRMIRGEVGEAVTGRPLKVAQSTATGWINNATTPEDMTSIYNFALNQKLLDDPKFRMQFLVAFEKGMQRVGRGEIRRLIGTGNPVDDDVASVVWNQISTGGLRAGELLRSTNNPKFNDYASAIRTSYSKKELDEVGAIIQEASPALKQAEFEQLRAAYSRQQELVFGNAFNRIQQWLKREQGEQLKVMSSEIRRLGELPPGKKVEFPEPMRSKAKGVRKATDPSSSPIEGPTGSYSWRGGEGEMGISQLRSQALDTNDLHQAYITRSYLGQKARERSSIFTRTVKRGDDRIGQSIDNVTYADAGLQRPYIVGKAHDNVNVRMIGSRPRPQKSRTPEEFSERVASSAPQSKIVVTNVGKLPADQRVDRVFIQNLTDDLTLMTRPDSDFIVRSATGEVTRLPRGAITNVSDGLPNNLTPEQAKRFIETLDLRELQRAEMQNWVDRYGYRMLYDTHYARTLTELDSIAERLAAAYVSGQAPKGFYELTRQTMSQKAALLPTGSMYTGPGARTTRRRPKRYRGPEFRFQGKTSMDDFMNYLSSNIPAGTAARNQGVRGIQFPQ